MSTKQHTQTDAALIEKRLAAITEILLADTGRFENPNRARRVLGRKLELISEILRRPDGHHCELVRGPLHYNEDMLATRALAGCLDEEKFQEAYRLGKAVSSWGREIRWRAYVVCWAASHAMTLPGDFVECGVDQGGYARAIIHYTGLGASDKTMYLLDTFHGPEDELFTEREKELRVVPEGKYVEIYERVKATFAPWPNVRIIRGAVPGTLEQVRADKVAYLSIDMNCAAPEVAAVEYFWDKLVPAAPVIFDDYAFPRHIEQHEALDRFAASHGVRILTMPSGQGLLIKP